MIKNIFFGIMSKLEMKISYLQGKGYGANSINQEIKCLLSLLNTNPRIAIDIGGNVGDYSAALRNLNKNLEIHIFEPSPVNINVISRRFSEDNNLIVVPHALSDKNDSAVLFSDNPGSVLGSLSKRRLDHFGISFNHQEPVSIIRFESYWVNNLKCRQIDIVKIDIEGHEIFALQGFGEAINAVKVIQFEFGGCNIDTKTYFQDFWYFFKEKMFEIYRITPFGVKHITNYSEREEIFLTTNYIAVNTR